MNRRVVAMSGYPASGKSTLAAALAERLDFALLSKDAMLATLYTAFQFAPGDTQASLRTGAAAWAVFWMQARLCPQVVLDSNIQWASREQIEALQALGGSLVEVRCDCPAEIAKARFVERARTGHAAQRFTELDDARLAAYARPLGVGALIVVDTSQPVDADQVAEDIRRRLAAA
jgi:predicted kinase